LTKEVGSGKKKITPLHARKKSCNFSEIKVKRGGGKGGSQGVSQGGKQNGVTRGQRSAFQGKGQHSP